MHATPTVGIGLPVRDGATYLAEAIDSILAQTFPDFELVISDNASSDRTPEICRAYARRDRRIRFYRQERNIGAAGNFNLVFHRSSGKYFKWAAHDDVIHPTYLARCIAALEADPDAVLCQSVLEIVDGGSGEREVYDHIAFGTDRPRQSDRLAARLRARRCTEVFGVIRRDALHATALIADHVGADRTLLIELALRGRFAGVPELLFLNRDHPERFTRRNKTLHAQAAWFAPAGPQRRVLRTWTLYATCLRLVRAYASDPAERVRCYGQMIRSFAYHRRWFRLALEPIEAIEPRAFRIERWLFGTAVCLKRAARRLTGAPGGMRVGETARGHHPQSAPHLDSLAQGSTGRPAASAVPDRAPRR
jgi:glycosyltransferase involved in cell wall biosynthesis